ncbi:hypothetical protein WH277_23520 [Erwinia sp. MYb416]|uniref:hypothetical protein n=1 Tax=Erwinia sp. MYb416 TaxID=3108532 RepID=UPI0030B14088
MGISSGGSVAGQFVGNMANGLLAGMNGSGSGYDITVGKHTRLDGAVIGSTATSDKNRLDTGTLGFSNIENRAEYQVEHQSVGISSGG